jgi:hypothetical protein
MSSLAPALRGTVAIFCESIIVFVASADGGTTTPAQTCFSLALFFPLHLDRLAPLFQYQLYCFCYYAYCALFPKDVIQTFIRLRFYDSTSLSFTELYIDDDYCTFQNIHPFKHVLIHYMRYVFNFNLFIYFSLILEPSIFTAVYTVLQVLFRLP